MKDKPSILFNGDTPRQGIDLNSLRIAVGKPIVHQCCVATREGEISISDNMLYVVSYGTISFSNSQHCFTMKAGEMVLLRKGMQFSFKCKGSSYGEFKSHMIILPEEVMSEYKRKLHIKANYSIVNSAQSLKTHKICDCTMAVCNAMEEHFKADKAVDVNLQTANIELLLLNIANCNPEFYRQIVNMNYGKTVDIAELVSENWDKVDSISELAKKIGVSEAVLLRKFKASTGMGLKEYILDKTIEKAKDIFTQYKHITIHETAKNLGYSTPQSFIRAFKSHEGLTPEQWRRQQEMANSDLSN